MKLAEAEEILKTFHDHAACTLDATSANAFQLGIEALKRVKAYRKHWREPGGQLLPGESEE